MQREEVQQERDNPREDEQAACETALRPRAQWSACWYRCFLRGGVASIGILSTHPLLLVLALPWLLTGSTPALAGLTAVFLLTPRAPLQLLPLNIQGASLALFAYLWLLARRNLVVTSEPHRRWPLVTVWGRRYAVIAGGMLIFVALTFRQAPSVMFLGWASLLLLLALELGLSLSLKPLLWHALRGGWVVLLTFVVAELGGRWLLPPELAPLPMGKSDKDYVFRLTPGHEGTFWFPSYDGEMGSFGVSLNRDGLRTDPLGPKHPGEFRVAVVGDSYTFGWCLNQQDTYVQQLEDALRQLPGGENVRVINGGVGGYGPWQEVGTLKRILARYHPDLVLFQSFVNNDIDDSLVQVGKRLRVFLEDHHEHIEFNRMRLRHWQYRLEELLIHSSFTYRALCVRAGFPLLLEVYGMLRFLPPLPAPEPQQSLPGPWIHQVDLVEEYPELTEGWALFKQAVREMRALCRTHQVGFAAFNIPFPTDDRGFPGRIPPGDKPENYLLDKGSRKVEALFRAEDIPSFSLLETFRLHPAPAALYFHGEGHLNEIGAALVAKRILEFLLHEYPGDVPWRQGFSST